MSDKKAEKKKTARKPTPTFMKPPFLILGLMAISCLLLIACDGNGGDSVGPIPPPLFGARVITAETAPWDLFNPALEGSAVTGRVGDIAMANSRIKIVIQAPGRDVGLGPFGGTIIDAGRAGEPTESGFDAFGELTPHFLLGMSPRAETVEIVDPGGKTAAGVVEVRGPADLFDFLDAPGILRVALQAAGPVAPFLLHIVENGIGPFEGPSFYYPDLSVDLDIVTRYVLEPDVPFVKITTTITNNGSGTFRAPAGDIIDPRGDLEWFLPASVDTSQGFGETFLATVDWMGFAGPRISYGYLPAREALTGSIDTFLVFFGGAVLMITGSTDVLDVFLPDPNHIPFLQIPPGGSGSWTRCFIVGEASLSSVSDTVYEINGVNTGRVRGLVREEGTGVALPGVRITALENGSIQRPITQFTTDAEGRFGGSLPAGDYGLIAAQASDFGSDNRPALLSPVPVAISVGETVEQDLTLGRTGTLRIEIRDVTSGAPVAIPGKVTLVGIDPTPRKSALMDIAADGDAPGIPQVYFLIEDQTVRVEPGEYQLVVSHGPEYDMHSERRVIIAGNNGTLRADLTRVVDTTGYLSADFHVHQLGSFDSQLANEDRLRAFAAGGVEVLVPSDHEVITDLSPVIRRLDLQEQIVHMSGLEVTTAAYGHFNAWPLAFDPDSRTGGAINHASMKEVPVEVTDGDPSLPADLDGLTPAQFFEAIDKIHPGTQVLQVNHARSTLLGYFQSVRLDFSRIGTPEETGLDPTHIRLAPGADLFVPGSFTALEIQNGPDLTALTKLLNDWFALLHLGQFVAGTSVSDSHEKVIHAAGWGRSYVQFDMDDPAILGTLSGFELLEFREAFATAINAQMLVGSTGIFLTASLRDDDPEPSAIDAAGPGETLTTTTPGGPIDGSALLDLRVQSPTWAEYDRILVFIGTPARADPLGTLDLSTPEDLAPEIVFDLGALDGFRRETVSVGGSERYETNVTIPFTSTRDTWVIAVVHGTPGRSGTLYPVVPVTTIQVTEETSIEDLLVPEILGGVRALGFTNPIYLDIDGDGVATPAGPEAILPPLPAAGIPTDAEKHTIHTREEAGRRILDLLAGS